jgi:hypothetical protein
MLYVTYAKGKPDIKPVISLDAQTALVESKHLEALLGGSVTVVVEEVETKPFLHNVKNEFMESNYG